MPTESAQTESQMQYDQGFNAGLDEGFKDGMEKGLKAILDWLESRYMTEDDRPDRGSPKAQAILDVARDANKYITSVKAGEIHLPHEGGKHS